MTYFIFSKDNYKDAFAKAPTALQYASVSMNTAEKIFDIGQKNGTPEKTGFIAATVGYTLCGLLPIRLLIEALRDELGVQDQLAQNIAQDIRREILAPVAHDLAAMQPQAEKNYAAIRQSA
jgi:hypothetical protein